MGYSQEFCCTEANNMSLLSDSIEDGVILLLTAKKKMLELYIPTLE